MFHSRSVVADDMGTKRRASHRVKRLGEALEVFVTDRDEESYISLLAFSDTARRGLADSPSAFGLLQS